MNISVFTRNLRSKKFWFSMVAITFGALAMAAGFVLFTNPYKIIPGGVYGLGRILHYLIPSIQTGTFGLMLDVPLMITGLIVFGSSFGFKTVYAALITPVFMNAMTDFFGENPADGISIISKYINLSDNFLVAAIFGGVFIGAGVGIIVKFGATSGGTDIVGMLFVKFAKMKFSSAVFMVESVIVVVGMLVLQDWKLPLYSLVSIFVFSKVVDFVIEGSSSDKLLFIITDKNEQMKQYITDDLGRGGTYLKAKGMYSGNDREVIFVVVSLKQITVIQDKIKEVDPDSFVVIVNAQDTYGDGFKSFADKTLV